MSDAKGNQEPSMEEILASIRRIISEDGEPKEEPAAPAVNGHAPEPAEEVEAEEDDALVLTDMVVGESNVVELKEEPAPPPAPPAPPVAAAPPPEPIPEPEPEIELTPEPEPEPEPETEPEPEIEPVPVQQAAAAEPEIELDIATERSGAAGTPQIPLEGTDEALVSPDVAAASAATMAQLVARKTQAGLPRATSIDGLLVETLVRQAVEPMLKDWLDEHLQEIVERLVRREVERLARKAELS